MQAVDGVPRRYASRVCRLALLALAVGLLAAGCGGGSSEPKTFSQQADALCQRAEGEFDKLGDPPGFGERYAAWVDKAVEIAAEYTAGLSALEPPSSLEGAFQSYVFVEESALGSLRDIKKKLAEIAGTLQDTRQAVQPYLDKLSALSTRENPLEARLGMVECAKT